MTTKEQKFYFSKFKDNIFVLKIGGEVIKSKKILENILSDIKDLLKHGIRIVLVHGGGSQADELAEDLGHTPTKVEGRRITGLKDLEIVKMLYGGSLNLEILSIMKMLGFMGLRVSGLDGNLLEVTLRSKLKLDYGFVGDIKKVNPDVLLFAMEKNYVPVVSPLGVTNDGTIVNINADTIATRIAASLKADKLIFFTTSKGVMQGRKLIKTLSVSEAREMIADSTITDGMRVKAENCIEAVSGGVNRVHIIDGLSPHSLLNEVLTKDGVGTMLVSDSERDVYLNETK